jgi:hypothetical protein
MQFLREVAGAVSEISFSDLTEYGKSKLKEAAKVVKVKSGDLYCKATGQKTSEETLAESVSEFNQLLKEAQMSDEEYEEYISSYKEHISSYEELVEVKDTDCVCIDDEGWEVLDNKS